MSVSEHPQILVIESDEKVGGLLSRLLGRKGFDVELRATGADGVDRAFDAAPTVALVSAVLSDGSGADVCDELRLLNPGIVLVLMGAQSVLDQVTGNGQIERADHLVYKPYSAVQLLGVLERAVESANQRPVAAAPAPQFEPAEPVRAVAPGLEDLPSNGAPRIPAPGEFDDEIDSALESIEEVLSSDMWPVQDSPVRTPTPMVADVDVSSGSIEEELSPSPSPDYGSLLSGEASGEGFGGDESDFGDLFTPVPTPSHDAGLLNAPPPTPPPMPPPAPGLEEPAPQDWAPQSTALQTLLTPVSDRSEESAHGSRGGSGESLRVWGDGSAPGTRLVGGFGQALRDEMVDGSVTWRPDDLRAEAKDIEAPVVAIDEGQFLLQPMVPVEPNDPRGIYGEVTMAQVIYNCFRDLFTGQLVVRRGNATKIVFILNGRPINSESNIRAEALGSRLMGEGIITEQQHRESVARVHRDGVRQGEALIAMGAIDAPTLSEYLSKQVRDRVINCFSWTDAEYGLTYDPKVQERTDTFEVNPLVLVFDGIKNAFPVAPLVTYFDERSRQPIQSTELMHNYQTMLRGFGDSLSLANLCNGRRTLGDLLNEGTLGLIDTLRILRALEIIGCVKFGSVELDSQPAPSHAGPLRRAASTRDSDRGSRRPPTSTRPLEAVRSSSRRPSTGPTVTGERGSTQRPSKRANPTMRSGEHARVRPSSRNTSSRPISRGAQVTGAPTPAVAPTAVTEQEQLRKMVNSLHDALGVKTHYELFGVKPGATTDEIRAAFQRIISVVHPNRVATLGDVAMNARSNEIVEHLARAYAVLKEPRERQAYDALRLPPPDSTGEVEPDIMKAEENFAKGRHCMDSGQVESAQAYFELAHKQDTHTRVYEMYLLWARFSGAKDRRDAAILLEDLKMLVTGDGQNDEGFSLLGDAMMSAGARDQAEKHFNRAIKLNRNNRRAARALQELARTRDDLKADGGSGLFGKLFTRR